MSSNNENPEKPPPPGEYPEPGDRLALIRSLLAEGPGPVHLLGIGGVGMSGLAHLLQARGLDVSGCDPVPNRLSDRLQRQGIPVFDRHTVEHIASDTRWMIRSTAVPRDHEEVQWAERRGIPVFQRGVVLAALVQDEYTVAVSGTHGKTTTTALIAQVLQHTGINPGFCVGGELEPLGQVASAGDGSIMIVEADESDGTLVHYRPAVSVITNIEFDHMEHFRDEAAFLQCFQALTQNTSDLLIYGRDDHQATRLCRDLENTVSFGFHPESDLRAEVLEENPHGTRFNLEAFGKMKGELFLSVPGVHNVSNALAACAVALDQGCDLPRLQAALASFHPVRRRFEQVCEREGIVVISDYAHHPTEIAATVRTAGTLRKGRVLAVFQPHRYTRTRALGALFPPAFVGLDHLVITPVYAASESPLQGGTGEDLYARCRALGETSVEYCPSLEAAWDVLKIMLRPDDVLLVLGAGDVEKIGWWARDEWETAGETDQFE